MSLRDVVYVDDHNASIGRTNNCPTYLIFLENSHNFHNRLL